MKAVMIVALALLAAPAWAQAGGKPAVCQYRTPSASTQGMGMLTVQMNVPCLITGSAGQRSVVTPPRNGTAAFSANGGDLRYTPRRGFVGADEFVYAVATPQAASGRRLITVNVVVQREPLAAATPPPAAAPPDWPVCRFSGYEVGGTNQAVETATSTMRVRAGARCGFNVNLQNVTVQQDTAPTHGTLFVSGVSVTYTAPAGYNGGDSFVVRWSRGGQIRRVAVVVEVR